ncbi:MAG: MEKHLA domain-containing protein [Hydrococcus sp. C42_A2020_068]|uniref:MEKHLA domain-containing protein n=1 Tax=Pleurocapsa sp. PCC 7327 TaxID=118163 RepID=UPI00029FAC10|nr:MEKHLA domain-containing protein [Pleurocapsa sp. PCC 7327]AFY77442.1 MEKHLA domain-containing protein [Pleurocapsa sp. PCC 7327]MBF2019654.1 MEKHLA domain-containing protein [Hydrococcus sp. C42_A2020_068]
MTNSKDVWQQPEIISWSQILLNSYEKLLKKPLMERKGDRLEQAKALFLAPFVVVSHGTESDPILNYGNQMALTLWETSWQDFIATPSRLTAEPIDREERERMLALAAQQGFINDYRGIRISKTGRRFLIGGAIVWNLTDFQNRVLGQAATFSQWSFLE